MSSSSCGSNAHDSSDCRLTEDPQAGDSYQHSVRSMQRDFLSPPALYSEPYDSDDPQCLICSYKQEYPSVPRALYHRHFSTISLREMMGAEDSGQSYFCPSCKSRHRPYLDERLKVVVSDSTLHDFFTRSDPRFGSYEGDLVHADYITIKGGTLPDLLHAFKQQYSNPKKPLDVVIVAGYTDILQNFSRDYILWGFKEFAATVLGTEEHPNPVKNTLAVSTLMYPPRLCWFEANGPVPFRYQNHLEKFDWLNKKIHELNVRNCVTAYPSFHTYGTRKSREVVKDSEGKDQLHHFRAHRWEHWHENGRRDKLTLRVDRLYKLGKALNNYFLYRTMPEDA